MTKIQRDKYYTNIKGKYVKWTGTVAQVDKTEIAVKCLERTISFDFLAEMNKEELEKLMNIQKGCTITIKGRISLSGGDIMPWGLNDCIIIEN